MATTKYMLGRTDKKKRGFQLMAQHLAKLIPPLKPSEKLEANKDWFRAAGNTVCEKCNLPYVDHPVAPETKILKILCDGKRVKL